MCLLGVALKVNDQFPFIFAGNRDESKDRPTKNAHFWLPNKRILAGKDLEKGGTWLGITMEGWFAALTNVREFPPKNMPKSRGELVRNFLENHDQGSLNDMDLSQFDGFNMLHGTVDELTLMSNRTKDTVKITEGVHAVSNGILSTAWPKVKALQQELEKVTKITDQKELEESLFSLLKNETQYPDEELPNTGIGLELERVLSSIFIPGASYGTRSSTVILVDRDRNCYFVEKTYDPIEQKKAFYFQLE